MIGRNRSQVVRIAALTLAAGLLIRPAAGSTPPGAAEIRSSYATASGAASPGSLRSGVYTEDLEGFSLGAIHGIGGWQANNGAAVSLSGSQTGDAPEPLFGDRSLAVNFNVSVTGSALSPLFASGAGLFGLTEADVLIYELPGGGSDLATSVTTVNLATGTINARVMFRPSGVIEVLQAVGGAGVFEATTGSWTLGQRTRIGIEVLPANIVNVYQDGALIFTGHDIAQELGGAPGGVNFVRFDTWIANSIGPRPYFDNFSFVEAAPPPGVTELVSVSSTGTQANAGCSLPSISDNGRFVAFDTTASTLTPGDTNGSADVFVRDRDAGTTERISVTTPGDQVLGSSSSPFISANGMVVAFISDATSLTGGGGLFQVVVRDRLSSQTTLVSKSTAGDRANQAAIRPAVSADGRFVAFESTATNLVSPDTNSSRDIFVHDRQTGETTRVSVATGGVEGLPGESEGASISADGRFVAFISRAPDLVANDTNGRPDVFVHDRQTGETTRVSVSSTGEQATGFAGDFTAISADGRYVAFENDSSNLVAGDTNLFTDIFVHDRQTGQTTRVNVSSEGNEAVNSNSFGVDLSADGRFVAFRTAANNLVPGDTNSGTDVFVHDRMTGETSRVEVSTAGAQSDETSIPGFSDWQSSVSGDGRFVAFMSAATNLVTGDANGQRDIFVRDRQTNACPEDLTADGMVDGADLGILLGSWGGAGPADLNDDGVVDGADFGLLLGAWGSCAP